MKLRILSVTVIIILSLMTVFCLASCQTDNGSGTAGEVSAADVETPADGQTDSPSGTADETVFAAETESMTGEATTEDTTGAVISSPEISVFRIVYPKDASETVKQAAAYLAQALQSAFGTAPEVVDDSNPPVPGDFEILVGKTNRTSCPLNSDADEHAWQVKVTDSTVELDAVNDGFLVRAADRLVNGYADGSSVLGLRMITDYTDNGEIYRNSLHFSVPGEPCYTVVYNPDDGDDAAFTAQWFAKSYTARGNKLLVSDSASDGAYVRLDVNEGLDTDWKVTFDGGNITVSAKNRDALCWGLTVLTGSRMVPDRYGEILISDTTDMSGDMSACTREGWGLPVPAYEGGTLSKQVYNCGSGKENDSKALAYSETYMMCVSGTKRNDFDAYLEKLESCGYVADSVNTFVGVRGENCYAQYVNGVSTVYVYFLFKSSEVRIIDDRASVPESVFEYDYTPAPDDTADVILYGLHMHPLGINSNEPDGDPDISNCGEFMMIRQPDNALFLIDGGSKQQATDNAVEGAWRYMHEITGTPDDQKIRISCWFISHPHGDHCNIVCKLLEKHGDMIILERAMFNFVNNEASGLTITQTSRTYLNKYSPDTVFMKCHTGQSIRLGGVVYDVLTTHEDYVDAKKGTSTISEFNSTSSVLRVTMPDGQRALILGDATLANESFLTNQLNKKELSCRIVQVAHHAWNPLSTIYRNASPEYALWPQYDYTNFTNLNNHYNYASGVAKALTKSGVKYNYFAGLNTARLTCKDGEITVTLTDTVY